MGNAVTIANDLAQIQTRDPPESNSTSLPSNSTSLPLYQPIHCSCLQPYHYTNPFAVLLMERQLLVQAERYIKKHDIQDFSCSTKLELFYVKFHVLMAYTYCI